MPTKLNPIIRPGVASDIPHILSLIHGLAAHVEKPGKVQATEATLLSTLGFDPPGSPAYAKTLLVFPEDSDSTTPPAGMAVYINNYSTWLARPGIRLEDLYVRPEYRGRGYGLQLVAALAKEVVDIGGGRLEWAVLKWNEPTVKFYESLGAEVREADWQQMRVDGDALLELSKKGLGIVTGVEREREKFRLNGLSE